MANPRKLRHIHRVHYPDATHSRTGLTGHKTSLCGKQIPTDGITIEGPKITCGSCITVIFDRARGWSELASMTRVRENLDLAPMFEDAARWQALTPAQRAALEKVPDDA